MEKSNLYSLGLNSGVAQEAALYKELHLARISVQHKELYMVITEQGELRAGLAGKLQFLGSGNGDYPAVGDWVMVDRLDDRGGHAIIQQRLPRSSVLVRRAAGTAYDSQVMAANIDVVFICMALNHDFNLRRLERYLSLVWDSRAKPVVVLTKADLCPELSGKLSEVYTVALGVDVLVTTAMEEDGYGGIRQYIAEGTTVAFTGSSGVGKSTLINRLLGSETLATGHIRADDRGRHTTTHRQLLLLPGGGIVIDTPGMRELQLANADLGASFADIEQLAGRCRFRDCSHDSEPGCAVQAAVREGTLAAGRLQNYVKLQHELSYQGLNSRQLEQEKTNRMFKEVGGRKQARDLGKQKQKRR